MTCCPNCHTVSGYPPKRFAPFVFACPVCSLTDQTNLFNATDSMQPTSDLYWQGRSTNAPGVWVDYVVNITQAVPVNLAFAGADEFWRGSKNA
jgi:hypothetical protein